MEATILLAIIMIIAVGFDLWSAKVPNTFVVCAFLSVLFLHLIHLQKEIMIAGLFGLGLATIIGMALTLSRVWGAGDLKIFMIMGFATSAQAVSDIIFYSLIWGSIFGLLIVLLKGQFKALLVRVKGFQNTSRQTTIVQFHMPFAVALFLGWLSHLKLIGVIV